MSGGRGGRSLRVALRAGAMVSALWADVFAKCGLDSLLCGELGSESNARAVNPRVTVCATAAISTRLRKHFITGQDACIFGLTHRRRRS